jgi:N4-gp56 family major capsid protein
MATTVYTTNNALTVKLWAKKLWVEALKETFISRFMGEGMNSLITMKSETSKSAGDRVRQGLRVQLSGAGISGDGTLEGNEEALVTYTDDLLIDQLRHAVRSGGAMSEQRVHFNVREEMKDGLKDWWADRLDTWFFNAISGNTGQADTRYTGFNATAAPTTTSGNTRHLFADGTHTTEASLSTTDVFQLTFLDRAVTTAKTATPLIRPVKYKGGEYFVAFLHPFQVYSLKTDATAARVTWYDAQKARVQGGEMDNGIFNGALGIYNNVVIHEAVRLPAVTANTRRAVLCGAQAALMGHGQGNTDSKMTWHEETFDYGNQLGIEAGMIAGLKKSVFNSNDFGTIVITTRATAP